MRRKERAERELKQLKGDVSAKEQELSEQSAAKAKLNETIGQLERSGREQKELGAALEADLEAVNEKFSKLQQDHETQMSLYQQLEMELARKSSELSEKEDVEIQVRSEVMMQKKDIDNLGKKISGLEALKSLTSSNRVQGQSIKTQSYPNGLVMVRNRLATTREPSR